MNLSITSEFRLRVVPDFSPKNDGCEDAISVAYTGSPEIFVGDTSFAYIDFASGVNSPGLWYSVIGDGAEMIANTCSDGTNFDTILNVYRENCNALETVDSNDDFCDTQSQVSWFGEVGAVYLLFVSLLATDYLLFLPQH